MLDHAVAHAPRKLGESLGRRLSHRFVRPLRHHRLHRLRHTEHLVERLVLERLEPEEVDCAVEPRERRRLRLGLAVLARSVVCLHCSVVAEHIGEGLLNGRGGGLDCRRSFCGLRDSAGGGKPAQVASNAGQLLAEAPGAVAKAVRIRPVLALQRLRAEVGVALVDCVRELVQPLPAGERADRRPGKAGESGHRVDDQSAYAFLNGAPGALRALGDGFAHSAPEAALALAGLLRTGHCLFMRRDTLPWRRLCGGAVHSGEGRVEIGIFGSGIAINAVKKRLKVSAICIAATSFVDHLRHSVCHIRASGLTVTVPESACCRTPREPSCCSNL